jgi:hypothetical protein
MHGINVDCQQSVDSHVGTQPSGVIPGRKSNDSRRCAVEISIAALNVGNGQKKTQPLGLG